MIFCDNHEKAYFAPGGQEKFDMKMRRVMLRLQRENSSSSPVQHGPIGSIAPPPPPRPVAPLPPPAKPVGPQIKKPTVFTGRTTAQDCRTKTKEERNSCPEKEEEEQEMAMSALMDVDCTLPDEDEGVPQEEGEMYISPFEQQQLQREAEAEMKHEKDRELDRYLIKNCTTLLAGAYENYMSRNVVNIEGFARKAEDCPGFSQALEDVCDDMLPEGLFTSSNPYIRLAGFTLMLTAVSASENAGKAQPVPVPSQSAPVPTQEEAVQPKKKKVVITTNQAQA